MQLVEALRVNVVTVSEELSQLLNSCDRFSVLYNAAENSILYV